MKKGFIGKDTAAKQERLLVKVCEDILNHYFLKCLSKTTPTVK